MLEGLIQAGNNSAVKELNGETKKPFWFRETTKALEHVTGEVSNSVLGIQEISLWTGTENQVERGIVCKGLVKQKNGTSLRFEIHLKTNDEMKMAYPTAVSSHYTAENGRKTYNVFLGDCISAQVLRLFEESFTLNYEGLYDYLNTKVPVTTGGHDLLDDED